MIAREQYEKLLELIKEVDADIIADLRAAPWESRKELLNQLDTLTKIEERLYARSTRSN